MKIESGFLQRGPSLEKARSFLRKTIKFYHSFSKDGPPSSRLERQKQRGDTIVEVLISLAIISVVLAAGYALASHSLNSSTRAQQRSEALAYAQGQVEFIKNACSDPSAPLCTAYKNQAQGFCVQPSGAVDSSVNTDGLCSNYPDKTTTSPYGVGVIYDPLSKVFSVSAAWTSTSGSALDELDLYYKLPGQGAPVCDPATESCGCAPSCPTADPDFAISASPKSLTIPQGGHGSTNTTTQVINGFNAPISLSASGVPANATSSFKTNPVPAPGNGTSRLRFNIADDTPKGTYTVKVTGDGGGKNHFVNVTLKVVGPPNPPPCGQQGQGGPCANPPPPGSPPPPGGGCVYDPSTPWITCQPPGPPPAAPPPPPPVIAPPPPPSGGGYKTCPVCVRPR